MSLSPELEFWRLPRGPDREAAKARHDKYLAEHPEIEPSEPPKVRVEIEKVKTHELGIVEFETHCGRAYCGGSGTLHYFTSDDEARRRLAWLLAQTQLMGLSERNFSVRLPTDGHGYLILRDIRVQRESTIYTNRGHSLRAAVYELTQRKRDADVI